MRRSEARRGVLAPRVAGSSAEKRYKTA